MNMRKDRTQNTEHRTQIIDLYRKKNSLESGVWSLESEKGMVLIVSLLLLLVATVVGITALSTSTTNVMITGNQRLSEINLSAADSGLLVSAPIINDTLFNDKQINAIYSALVSDNFANEGTTDADCPALTGLCTSAAPDIQYTIGDTRVSVDIDYLYAAPPAGSAIMFACGYEGAGKCPSSSGGINVYYRINSFSEGDAGSVTGIGAVYRYVPS